MIRNAISLVRQYHSTPAALTPTKAYLGEQLRTDCKALERVSNYFNRQRQELLTLAKQTSDLEERKTLFYDADQTLSISAALSTEQRNCSEKLKSLTKEVFLDAEKQNT